MLTFLIMAGGSGERFWPLSTKEKPKQLLNIFSDKSLIRMTYERILPIADNSRIFIATNEIQVKSLKEELKEIDDSRIIIEPAFRDTSSAIAYGSTVISKYYDDPTICVLASDHMIHDSVEFRKVIKLAQNEAQKNNIVTLGIKPKYPETGYGYIEVKSSKLNVPTKSLGFKEKPSVEIASKYFESGKYLWNSGMFIFKYSTLLNSLKQHCLDCYETTMKIDKMFSTNEGVRTAHKIKEVFMQYNKLSIDYAVMEHADNIIVIPSEFGWNDVGNYTAFENLFDKDEQGNVIRTTKTVVVDSYNNIIVSDGKYQQLSLLGIHDMIVVITKDNVLICSKEKNQDIKKLCNC